MSRKKFEFEIIYGYPNNCISINDTRITEAKLYGYGRVIRRFSVNVDKIKRLIDGKDKVTFHLLNRGRDGVFLEGERITSNGTKKAYQEYMDIKNEELRLLKKSWSNKRANAYFDGSIVTVNTQRIKERIECYEFKRVRTI